MSFPVGMIPPEISRLLEPRERLHWWDRPKRGFVLRSQDLFLIPFSLVWCGGVFMAFYLAVTGTPNPIAIGITTFMAIAGTYILVGRFIHDSWRRSRLLYAVTDRRILILSPSNLQSIDIESVSEINSKRTRGNFGTLSFGSTPSMFARKDLGAWSGKPVVPTFEFIRDADKVFALIRETRRKAQEEAHAS